MRRHPLHSTQTCSPLVRPAAAESTHATPSSLNRRAFGLKGLWFGLLTLTLAAGTASGQPLEPLAGSRMWVDGTSTLHDWTVDVETVNGRVVAEGRTVTSVELEVPVASMKSGKGGMDDKMYGALDIKRHPVIRVSGHDIVFTEEASQPGRAMAEAGLDVTIHGTTQTVQVTITQALIDDEIRYTGQVTFRMSEFGVDPPQALMGTVRAGDEITLRFDVRTPGDAQAAAL